MSAPRPAIWAYTYKLDPPQSATRLKGVQALLEREQTAARKRAGLWEGRVVVDERVSHILVLSDSPALDGEANRRLEAELHTLEAKFSLTVPMAVDHDAPAGLPRKD